MVIVRSSLRSVASGVRWSPVLIMLSWTPGCCTAPGAHGEPSTASAAVVVHDAAGAPAKPGAPCPSCK